MKWLTDFVFLPLRAAGRIMIGSAGFLIMGGGLFLLDVIALPIVGIPIFILGFLLLLKAVF